MAIVLPQGRFNNSSDKYIRDFITEHCRILAVVGLHGNVFKPHTGTKTSVLIVQKWDDKLCPKKEDYPIFFATMGEPSKDNSGDKIYETEEFVEVFDVTKIWDNKRVFVNYTKDEFYKKYESLDDVEKYQLKSGLGPLLTKKEFNSLNDNEKEMYDRKSYARLYKQLKLDTHGHLIVKHDLFNHDEMTQDGIAEAFIEFAKKENLSFF